MAFDGATVVVETPLAGALAGCGDADLVVVAPAAGFGIASRLMLVEAVLVQVHVREARRRI